MRKIKFRTWDEIQECYVYSEEFSTSRDFSFAVFQFGHSDWEKSKLQIQQYTGLKDKKGKEIYEGDICRWVSTEGARHTWPIIWDDDLFCYCHNNMPLAQLFDSGYYQPPREWPSGFEVIGNIHENPELLK